MGLIDAVKRGDVAEVEHALANGGDVTEQDFLGNTPLHHAAKANRADIARVLLAQGASRTMRNVLWRSAVHVASSDEMKGVLSETRTPDIEMWPARWMWAWLCLVAMGLVSENFEQPMALAILALPFSAMLAICAWWFSESKRRCRRPFVYRFFGYLVFSVGSGTPISATIVGASAALTSRRSESLMQILFPLAAGLAIGAVLIGASHLLVFQRQRLAAGRTRQAGKEDAAHLLDPVEAQAGDSPVGGSRPRA